MAPVSFRGTMNHGGRARARAGALAVVLLFAACSGGGDSSEGGAGGPTTSSEGDASGGSTFDGVDAEAASSAFPVEARDIRLVRVSDRELALQLELFNGTDAVLRPSDVGLDPLGRETLLADLPRRTVYGMLRADGLDARINADHRIPPDGTATVTAVFSAPPAEATEMLVMIGALEPVVAPIQAQGSTALATDPVLTGAVPGSPLVSPILSPVQGGGGDLTGGGPLELVLSGDVLFEFGSARLSPGAATAVSLIAEQVDRSDGTISVEGHTDSVGEDASNQILSEQRAAAVGDALRAELGGAFTYEAVGFGESRPVAPNQAPDGSDSPDGRAVNRRVKVRLSGSGQSGPAPLAPRALGDAVADAGFTARVEGISRMAGYLLLRLAVTNPTAGDLTLGTGDGFLGQNDAPDGVSLVDPANQRRHSMARWLEVSATEHYAGTFANSYGGERSGVVPPRAEVVFWGLYPAPASGVTSIDVEIGGFGEVVTAQAITEG